MLRRYYHILRFILHLSFKNVQTVNDIFCRNYARFLQMFSSFRHFAHFFGKCPLLRRPVLAIRWGEREEYITLFVGFSFVGKLIGLTIVTALFIWLWSMLFIIPGIIAAYRYRFAPYNLYENPGIGVMEALEMSKRQTMGYKGQLFALGLSYLGWTLLASLPAIVEVGMLYYGLFSSAFDYMNGTIAAMPADISTFAVLPAWLWTLIISLWSMAVSLFYLPNYQCVELGYYETAKRTSGVGAGAETPAIGAGPGAGPDGLGGL